MARKKTKGIGTLGGIIIGGGIVAVAFLVVRKLRESSQAASATVVPTALPGPAEAPTQTIGGLPQGTGISMPEAMPEAPTEPGWAPSPESWQPATGDDTEPAPALQTPVTPVQEEAPAQELPIFTIPAPPSTPAPEDSLASGLPVFSLAGGEPTTTSSTPELATMERVDVTMTGFSPGMVVVPKGSVIVFRNADSKTLTVACDELGWASTLEPGQRASIQIDEKPSMQRYTFRRGPASASVLFFVGVK